MKPMPRLAICVAACLLLGCGSEDSSSSSEAPSTGQAPAQQPVPMGQATPEIQHQAIVSDRTLDYIQGLVERREYDRARQSLEQLAGSQLTPHQQRRIAALQAKIPAN